MKSWVDIKVLQCVIMSMAVAVLSVSCGGGVDLDGNNNSDNDGDEITTAAFPNNLAVASPFSLTSTADPSVSATVKYATANAFTPSYKAITDQIGDILSGSAGDCSFDPYDFFQQEENTACFGPSLAYEGHPEAEEGEEDSGVLPIGDLGIWLENEVGSDNACSASELDAKLAGTQALSTATLMAVASMICTANANDIALPDATNPSSVDMLDAMNAMEIANVTFDTASVSYSAASSGYAYEIDMTVVFDGGDKEVHMEMEHVPTADSYVYSGDFFIMINESGYGGNCPDSDVTNNFTVAYEMTSKTSAALQARSAMFCGSDIDGRDANGYVAAGDKYSDENPDGWGNDYNLLTANFDPTTLDGNYSYAWQAGHFDNNTRVFNIIVTDEGTQGTSFYGYGDDIAATDGSIDGFICNWVAPGADHTMLEYVQQQDMSVDLETGLVSAEASFITYAPTTTCEYDGTGAFVFDTNIDDDLSDEDAALVITTDAGTMDLVPGADENGDSEATVEEVIEASGFTLPAM